MGRLVLLLLGGTSCSTGGPLQPEPQEVRGPAESFVTLAQQNPDLIWSPSVSNKVKHALLDYRARKKLPTGARYGQSVHDYDVRNKCGSEIEKDMKGLGCKKVTSVLQDPKTHQPLRFEGRTIPLVVYLCTDGGAVRVKPQGDPTSRFKKQPLVSKALRYPYHSAFETFDDEIVKVDNAGLAIPKWIKDLRPESVPEDQRGSFIQGWADDAHTDLKVDCG